MQKGKRCYYQVLAVDPKAPIEDIKTSYRKLVLQNHPDKNPDPSAKERFLQIQQAWQVLSDVNERTWYDNNRESVLYNKDDLTQEDFDQLAYGFNIWKYFSPSCFVGKGDEEEGFYATYRKVFELIKSEEKKAFDRSDSQCQFRKMPGFGNSKTSLQQVSAFYDEWDSFNTFKSFAWVDQYCLKQAPNRQVRRLMQKQNKKERVKEKKKYVKTIRDLVSHAKRRDPRWEQIQQIKKQEEEARRQVQKLQLQKNKKQKQEQKVVKQKLDQQRMQEAQEYFKSKQEEEIAGCQEFDFQDQQFYCKVCKKKFKSGGQLKNHQQSKAHKTAFNKIKKSVMTMQQAKAEIQEQAQIEAQPQQKKNKKKKGGKLQSVKQVKPQPQQQEKPKEKPKDKPKEKSEEKQVRKEVSKQQQSSSDDDMDRVFKNFGAKRVEEGEQNLQIPSVKRKKKQKYQSSSQEEGGKGNKKKEKEKEKTKGKADEEERQKGSKKKGKKQVAACLKCKQQFQSKTKLFQHLQKTGHSAVKR